MKARRRNRGVGSGPVKISSRFRNRWRSPEIEALLRPSDPADSSSPAWCGTFSGPAFELLHSCRQVVPHNGDAEEHWVSSRCSTSAPERQPGHRRLFIGSTVLSTGSASYLLALSIDPRPLSSIFRNEGLPVRRNSPDRNVAIPGSSRATSPASFHWAGASRQCSHRSISRHGRRAGAASILGRHSERIPTHGWSTLVSIGAAMAATTSPMA